MDRRLLVCFNTVCIEYSCTYGAFALFFLFSILTPMTSSYHKKYKEYIYVMHIDKSLVKIDIE